MSHEEFDPEDFESILDHEFDHINEYERLVVDEFTELGLDTQFLKDYLTDLDGRGSFTTVIGSILDDIDIESNLLASGQGSNEVLAELKEQYEILQCIAEVANAILNWKVSESNTELFESSIGKSKLQLEAEIALIDDIKEDWEKALIKVLDNHIGGKSINVLSEYDRVITLAQVHLKKSENILYSEMRFIAGQVLVDQLSAYDNYEKFDNLVISLSSLCVKKFINNDTSNLSEEIESKLDVLNLSFDIDIDLVEEAIILAINYLKEKYQ